VIQKGHNFTFDIPFLGIDPTQFRLKLQLNNHENGRSLNLYIGNTLFDISNIDFKSNGEAVLIGKKVLQKALLNESVDGGRLIFTHKPAFSSFYNLNCSDLRVAKMAISEISRECFALKANGEKVIVQVNQEILDKRIDYSVEHELKFDYLPKFETRFINSNRYEFDVKINNLSFINGCNAALELAKTLNIILNNKDNEDDLYRLWKQFIFTYSNTKTQIELLKLYGDPKIMIDIISILDDVELIPKAKEIYNNIP